MSILARILMLVACGPLLFPPGFCVCKAGDGRHAPDQAATTSSGLEQKTAHTATDCHHRHGISSPHHLVADRPCEPISHPAPAPHDDHHIPGCPAASPAVERLQWSEPTPGVTDHLLPATFVVVQLLATANSPRPLDRPGTHRTVSLPLYLSHCSLVI